MRTTLVLDDTVYREAKAAAAQRGATVSSLIEDALRLLLARNANPVGQAEWTLPVNSETSWVHPGIDINDNRALRAFLDEGTDINALR
jgi:2-keto-4-pentenoate hydratase